LVFRNDSDLFITVKFPVLSTYPNVYDIFTFPVPFHNNSNLVTILPSPTKYLLISYDYEHYAELDTPPSEVNKLSVDLLVPRAQFLCLFVCFKISLTLLRLLAIFRYVIIMILRQNSISSNYPQILIRSPITWTWLALVLLKNHLLVLIVFILYNVRAKFKRRISCFLHVCHCVPI